MDGDEKHLSYLKGRRRACWAATPGYSLPRDDNVKIFRGPHLDEGLIRNIRTTLEAGMSPEELLSQLANIIDVIMVDLRTPEEQ